MTGSRGGTRRQIAACCASSRLRRSAGSMAPSAARMSGQDFGRISRKLRTICQCSARSAGASLASRAKLAPSVATVSRNRARLAASAAAWPGNIGSRPRLLPHSSTSRVNSNWRRISGIAGGTARPPSPATPSTSDNSSESRSPIGRIRGSNSGVPGSLPTGRVRRNASRKARTARRVGSRMVMRGSASGSSPVVANSASANVARNGRSGAIV